MRGEIEGLKNAAASEAAEATNARKAADESKTAAKSAADAAKAAADRAKECHGVAEAEAKQATEAHNLSTTAGLAGAFNQKAQSAGELALQGSLFLSRWRGALPSPLVRRTPRSWSAAIGNTPPAEKTDGVRRRQRDGRLSVLVFFAVGPLVGLLTPYIYFGTQGHAGQLLPRGNEAIFQLVVAYAFGGPLAALAGGIYGWLHSTQRRLRTLSVAASMLLDAVLGLASGAAVGAICFALGADLLAYSSMAAGMVAGICAGVLLRHSARSTSSDVLAP